MSNKPHIVFVDDEANILMGLRRGLRSKRQIWDMSFVESGKDALDLLESEPIDIIVSDMRMPEMDGAQLLEQVRKRSPDTARVILSGYAKEEAVLKVVGPAHQYLAKPCDFDLLSETLERLASFRHFLAEHDVRVKITGKKSLPSLPRIYHQLKSELENPNSTNKTIAAVLEQDLSMKAQVLKVCNSAFFGLPQHINDLPSAVSLLGIDTLKSMVLLGGVFSAFEGAGADLKVLEKLSSNSIQIALIAHKVGRLVGFDRSTCDQITCAGTLSHIGSLVIATTWPAEFKQAMDQADERDISFDQIERRILGVDHAMVGAYVLGLWGFSLPICEAVAYHHCPEKCPDVPHPILTAIHIAQEIWKTTDLDDGDYATFMDSTHTEFMNKQKITFLEKHWDEVFCTFQDSGGES